MNKSVFFLSLLLTVELSEWTVPFIKEASAHNSGQHSAEGRSLRAQKQPESEVPLFNLGNHRHPISTQNPLAQRYFNQGLILAYGFNHAEAIRSFQEAARLDPNCAMCYWGIALALGPNINAPMADAAVPPAWTALQKAIALAPKASSREQAYIQALAKRYSAKPVSDRSPLDQAYANAMRQVAQRYPNDMDAATLFAEALMNLTPWNFWTKAGQPTTYTSEIVATLESVLQRNPNHPGANHFYIHAIEASQHPELAIPSAQRLETLVPGAGHLVHMPSHVYWRVGRYHDAARINEHAIHTDEATFAIQGSRPDQGSHSFYALAYYPHNIHFLLAAAQMEGRSQLALEAARKLVSKIPDQAYDQVPALEDFKPMPLFALVRFGQWQAILQEPQPDPKRQYTTGMWHWARGMAYVRLGKLAQARTQYQQLHQIAQTKAMKELTLASFPQASTLLDLASHLLAGELAGAAGQSDGQIAQLRSAVRIQDSLSYIEPPSWYYPVRQSLGVALLKANRAREAEKVYREDLRQYPNNGWSLFGLAQSLQAQGRSREAQTVQQRFQEAWKYADVSLTAAQF
jgi:tetratricopeptide (TPR) repeat protein